MGFLPTYEMILHKGSIDGQNEAHDNITRKGIEIGVCFDIF
jgi:hypothetical protein